MIPGWRSRLHYWSRRGDVLKKAAVGLVGAAFLLAWMMVRLAPEEPAPAHSMDPVEMSIRRDWQRLRSSTAPQPHELTHWLRKLTPSLTLLAESLDLPEATWSAYQQSGSILAYEVRNLLKKHLADSAAQSRAEDYLAACLSGKTQQAEEAQARLQKAADSPQPPAHANELYASLLLRKDHDAEALVRMKREGLLFPEAGLARETALRLALKLQEAEAMQEMASAGWLEAVPSLLEHEAGTLLGNLGMQWRGLLRHRLEHLPLLALLLTALSAGLWYVLLVMHLPTQPWRWAWPIAPIVAGIASVWPTITLIAFQQYQMGIDEARAPFPLDLWHLIIGVGFREEVCKLVLAAFFMPWLLWRRVPGLALMTGAFVGLGFALEENVDYYLDMGESVAVGRFLSANFMHLALTALSTQALYDMLRTRFAQAPQFLTTLGTLILAHAVYDYDAPQLGGLEMYLPMVILALLAWRFWDAVEAEMTGARQTISPAAVFLLGTAMVIAVSLIITAAQTGSWSAVLNAARDCAGILPVAVIYWRRFEGSLTSR